MVLKTYIKYIIVSVIFILNACNSSNKDLLKIACVGDSITFGHGINNREQNSYPAQLEHILGSEFDVENFGVSGATMLKQGDLSYWNQPELDSALAYNPNVVIIMLGSNDSKPWNWDKKDNYKDDYISLIEKFQALPTSPKIWICNPPPAFKTRWGIRDSVIREDIIPTISTIVSNNVSVIDLYKPFIDKGKYFPDFIHPDSTGASIIASAIANNISNY